MVVYIISYCVSYGLARAGYTLWSGVALMAAALWLYQRDYKQSGSPIHLRALFSLAWIGGQGISCLKLSRLQGAWQDMTWLCFFAAYTGFWVAFEVLSRYWGHRQKTVMGCSALSGKGKNIKGKAAIIRFQEINSAKRLLACIVGLTLVSWSAFSLEAFVLGYIPFFLKGVPHAYSEFHISGVHYFTVSCVLVPGLTVLYLRELLLEKKHSADRLSADSSGIACLMRRCPSARVAAVSAFLSLLVPILCVSRFQLIFGVVLAVLTFMATWERVKWQYVAGAVVLLIPLYLILTVARSHDVSYLNSIFEMRRQDTPIFITQPYMYVANNYDNFNCLVEALADGRASHSMGLKQVFPLFVFTGLKFKYPQLVSFELFTTKEELTTVTLFYDAYYDFGFAGVLLLSCVLGAVCWVLVQRFSRGPGSPDSASGGFEKSVLQNPVGYLFYGQAALYLMLSFFTTWFTNPTTWFYLAVTGLVYFVCKPGRKSEEIMC